MFAGKPMICPFRHISMKNASGYYAGYVSRHVRGISQSHLIFKNTKSSLFSHLWYLFSEIQFCQKMKETCHDLIESTQLVSDELLPLTSKEIRSDQKFGIMQAVSHSL